MSASTTPSHASGSRPDMLSVYGWSGGAGLSPRLSDVDTKQNPYFVNTRLYQASVFGSSERRVARAAVGAVKAAEPPPVPSAGEGLRPRFVLLRRGFVAFLTLVTLGLLLASFAIATAAGPLVTGIALAIMWSGNAAVTIAAHVHGRRSGDYLLSRRGSKAAVVLAVGMTLVAVIAAIEFSLK